MTDNADRIAVPGGISNPYQHTWQIGLRISHFWPVLGIVDGILCGNDGKLWAVANDKFYGYLHEETSGGTPLGTHYLTVEIQGASSLEADFWLGVEGNKPTQMAPDPIGTDDPGALYQQFGGFNLQLNTNYYFQISVNANGPEGDYYIGNCAPGCADAMVSGFPVGSYLYVWREDNTVLDLSGGGNWAEDVVLWKGGTPPTPGPPGPSPGPTPTPNSNLVKLAASVNVKEYQPRLS